MRGFARYRAALQGAPEELDDLATQRARGGRGRRRRRCRSTDPTVLSYAVAAAMILEVPEKQELLAAPRHGRPAARGAPAARRANAALIRVIPSLPAVEVAQVTVSPN